MEETYFSISYNAAIQIEPAGTATPPDEIEIAGEIPPLFMLSDSIEHLDPTTTKSLKKYGTEFSRLVDQVNSYANKINSILCYLMHHEIEGKNEYVTDSISGGGFSFTAKNSEFQLNSQLKAKIFFPEYAIAVFCYGRITETNPQTGKIKVEFSSIREEDRERMIGTVTRHQQKLLRKRAEERNKNHDNT